MIRFPGDPQTWYRLAAFQLGTLDAPEQALETLKGALYLNPHSGPASKLFLDARARQREKAGTAQPTSTSSEREQRARAAPQRCHRRSRADREAPQRVPRESAGVGRERVGAWPMGRCAGVVSASVPPGRSTRRTSDRNSCTSRTCSIVSAQRTRSKPPSSKGSGASGSSSTMRASGSRRARTRQRDGRHVRGGELRGVELAGEPAVAAAEVEGALHVAERVDEAQQRLGRRPGLLRHELPELVVVAAGRHGLRAISMSVCPNGASRGREPAGSSAWSSRCAGAGRRRQPKVTACSSGSSPASRAWLTSLRGEIGMSSGVPCTAGRARSGWPARVPLPPDARAPAPPPRARRRAQQALRLDEQRRQRPLVDHVVEHEPVEHDVERLRVVGQLARPADHAVVEFARLAQRADHRLVEVHARHTERGPREQVPARVPSAAHRQDIATAERQAPARAARARGASPGRSGPGGWPRRRVGRGGCRPGRARSPSAPRPATYQAPRARITAGIVLSRIVRSRNTDQRSR